MNGRILVMCPVLRAVRFSGLFKSILETSEVADVSAYICDPGHEPTTSQRRTVLRGPKLDLVVALNLIARENPGYDLYGFMPDDSIMTEPGWDAHLLGLASTFPNGVGMIDVPYGGEREGGGSCYVEAPFVTGRWLEAVGWYACPRFDFWYWHALSGIIGYATHLVRCKASKANIKHFGDWTTCGTTMKTEVSNVWPALTEDLPVAIDALRKAMV